MLTASSRSTAKSSTETSAPGQAAPPLPPGHTSPARLFWRRFRQETTALIGLLLIILFVLLAVLAPWISPFEFQAATRSIVPGPQRRSNSCSTAPSRACSAGLPWAWTRPSRRTTAGATATILHQATRSPVLIGPAPASTNAD